MTLPTPEIPISQIEVGSRFRKDYGDIDQLAYSIKSKGLLNPITIGLASKVRFSRETDLPFVLLAGGRRLKAVTKLGWSKIPVRLLDQPITELDFRAVELAENFDRKNLEYVEEVALMREINNLQIATYGVKLHTDPSSPGWNQTDTARLLNKSPSSVAKDLKLAEAIEEFPDLQLDKCKNKLEAFKRLKSIGTIFSNKLKAEEYTKNCTVSPTFERLSDSFIIGDCFETLSTFKDSSLDFIEIDPPYSIDLKAVKKNSTCIGYNEIDASVYSDFLKSVFEESYRVLKEGSWLICWFAQDPWFEEVYLLLKNAGFILSRIPAIWTKASSEGPGQNQTNQPETSLSNSYEPFFYARKGKAILAKPGRSNNFQYERIPSSQKYHPTQRPLPLMLELYSTFTKPGSVGFIPFLGSGIGLIAGHLLRMYMTGTELSSQYKDGYILELKKFLGAEDDPI